MLEETFRFQLNTSIEYPHEDTVNAMLFQPLNSDDNLQCITIGNDKKFKVWQLIDCSTVHKKGVAWRCQGVGFYRNLSCSSLSFSVDGSLMATGFGPILTCWVPDSCELKCSLIHPLYKEMIKQVQFGYGNQCHLLVSASENQLSVWNILTLSMVWTVPVKISLLFADYLSENMGVICKDNSVFIFSPASNAPIYSSKLLLKKFDEIVACSFIPSEYSNDSRLMWYERSQIYFITSNKELYCVSSMTNYIMIDNVVPDDTSMFSMVIPANELSLVQPVTPNRHVFEKDVGHKTIEKYIEGPIVTIAPITFSCYSLLKSLAVQK